MTIQLPLKCLQILLTKQWFLSINLFAMFCFPNTMAKKEILLTILHKLRDFM
uniref:Uncharacterized protein n=1 Tax=Rhizophora mucronata TaxID=61149 RepID=A0A2P2IU30_RHIMU